MNGLSELNPILTLKRCIDTFLFIALSGICSVLQAGGTWKAMAISEKMFQGKRWRAFQIYWREQKDNYLKMEAKSQVVYKSEVHQPLLQVPSWDSSGNDV